MVTNQFPSEILLVSIFIDKDALHHGHKEMVGEGVINGEGGVNHTMVFSR